ncbi:MAG: MFS transporter [Bryobacteraceae bacterium]
MRVRLRWVAIAIFFLSSSLNYLDRQLLAAFAPTLQKEFHLSYFQYGQIQSVFSIVYALVAPLAGLFIDRVGLNLGASIAVALWSAASVATGWVGSFRSLLACRTVLGIAEAAGIPSTGKANGSYLEPQEFALGTSVNQIGVSVGGVAAPLIAAALAPAYGWRSAFVLCGLLGFVWVPLWFFTSRRIPPKAVAVRKAPAPIRELLRDRRLWGLVFATIFLMSLYTVWTNWTTLYFVNTWHLSQDEANSRYAWIPQVCGTLGGFFGGWLAFFWIGRGVDVIGSRLRVGWISGGAILLTAAIPLMPTPGLAAAAISSSFFWTVCISTNLYALPIDMFGPARAAFGVSALTSAYGLMQTFASPAIGWMVDHFGFSAVCVAGSVLPLVGVWILHVTAKPRKV